MGQKPSQELSNNMVKHDLFGDVEILSPSGDSDDQKQLMKIRVNLNGEQMFTDW